MLFRVQPEYAPGQTILHCQGPLVYGEPSATLLHAGETYATRELILDLTGVDAVDASGLGALVGLEKWARTTGVHIRLLNPSKYLRELLQLTRLDRIFDIRFSAADTVQACVISSAVSAA